MNQAAAKLATEWNFQPKLEMEGGHCSYVYADNTKVLKFPWRGEEQTFGYQATLRLQECGGPRVYASDESTGAILMERILPGTTLGDSSIDEDEARQICRDLIINIQSNVAPDGFLNLAQCYSFQDPVLDRLVDTSPQEVFLHGDLHHFNILWSDSSSRWVPIDPKGLRGDPNFEPIAFMRNLVHLAPDQDALETLIRNRLAYFSSNLNLDSWRIAAWGWLDQMDGGESRNVPLMTAYERIMKELDD